MAPRKKSTAAAAEVKEVKEEVKAEVAAVEEVVEAPAKKTTRRKCAPKAEAKAEPVAEVKEEVKAEVKAEPKAEVKAEPKAEVKAEPKAEVKAEPKAEVIIEFGGVQVAVDEIIKNAKLTVGEDKDIKVYVKPEESKAYIVAGEESVTMDVYFC